MSMVDSYLTTPVRLTKCIGEHPDLLSPIYGEPVIIKCRSEGVRKLLLGGNTLNAVDCNILITAEKIAPRDLLDDLVVLWVKPIVELNGSISHYESYVGI